ncbi:unnamed protein product [Fusarium langsethiae]|nr:unnamed protein product [Fusarium langsethiae]
MAVAAVNPVAAQYLSFGADSFYRSNSVTIQPITFETKYNTTIAGNLFTRKNLSSSVASPAIVVGHPMGAVKEQSANLYATKLAEQGFVTISLDLPSFGRSEGLHNVVSPDIFSEAYSAAVDYIGTYNFVDRERIGALGICGSGSFIISTAKIDSRIKAVATASMYDMGAVTRDGLRKSRSLEQRNEVVAQASEQRWAETDGAATEYFIGTQNQLTSDSDVVAREFFDFYRTSRGEVTPEGWQRNQTTHRTLVTNVKFLNFYPFSDLDTISPRPLLIVSGTASHSREFSEAAYRNAAQPKELYWVPNAGHIDLYDRIDLIPFAKYTDFFRKSLV